MADEAMALSIR